MIHSLRFSSYRLLPVLHRKLKVAYSSSAIRLSSTVDWTSNLENHASRSGNSQQALMGSISLCICPPSMQCPGGSGHCDRHSQNQSSLGKSPDGNSQSGFPRTYCTPASDMRIEVLPQDPCSYLLFYFITSSRKSEWISGPVKTLSRILASLWRENYCHRYRNAVPLWSIAFTKFFMRPNFIWRGRNKILDDSSSEWCFIFLCPGSKIFLAGHILLT